MEGELERPVVVLSGKAVRLRPLRDGDQRISVHWRNDPAIRDYILGYRLPVTETMEAEWVNAVIQDRGRTRIVLGIEDKSDGALVGYVYLNGIDGFARLAEFGLLIGERSRQGRGLARESLELMARYAFRDLGLSRLWLRVGAFNERALRLYRSFGFIEEGRQRQQALVADKLHDVLLFGLMREDYETLPCVRDV
jgi:RimJ/RimL family protein N-acetyltransferase